MREVHVSEVTALVRRLCMEANYHLPEDIQQSFVRGKEAEQSPLGKTIFDEMIRNCRLACDQEVPICQDTGTAVIFASVGQDVHLVGGAFEDAVNEGVRQGYTDGYLRKSIVSDPLRRVNTNDNTPAVLHTRLVPGEEIEIIVAPKGGGSENMSALKMFTPAATRDQIVAYIADTVIAAGSNPCPPVIIGVGLGGTADKASELAKKALLRPVDVHSADEFYAEMERDILERVNKSGVGPQGLGGTVTALACAIEPYPTHIASLPCAISIGCHITRHAAGRI
ncbi:fumarate hydratase [Butyricicoccus pullicaecorum]|uniref:Fumarate hydratase n=1 Tax=Butyricicoccus pullicaecorum TaxID=501571 RepID=A0A1Y4LS64_9FIRM|nr:fumarate hydratase [Butyricicoccus pullicaecorum]OUP54572.1 fumarate hydratase [Butyricicoccus pullicaecorum]OUP59493.1 fumarate hydratase [Butyricicoccus pullicaecorum]HJF52771.1 fumarate hydratase [Butyricicoccus pullicaecorum]